MADTESGDVDQWLDDMHRRFLADIAKIIDVEAGLRAIIGPPNQDRTGDESAGRTDTSG